MLAGHQVTAGRGANCRAGVILPKAHSLRRQSVDVRRLYLLLPIAAQFLVSQIVSHNENDVGLRI